MKYIIYAVATISIVLALGGLSQYLDTKRPALLVSSVVSIVFSLAAVIIPHWWPIIVGYTINMALYRGVPR